MQRFILGLVALVLLLGGVDPVHAGFVTSFTPYNPTAGWQSIFNGFSTQENFDSTTLAPGLSITLSGGAFTTQETHTTLPALFDPTTVSAALGGPFNANTWGGPYMVTNFGYDATQPIGSRWLNAWAPIALSAAASISFDISGSGATSFGVGLSNFQSLSGPIPLTNHELYINGIDQGTIESLAGANFTPGADVRNAYLSVVATGGGSITSVTFTDLMSFNFGGPDWDGLNFGSLGYNTAPTLAPEPASFTLAGIGLAGLLGCAWRRRKQVAA